MLHKETMKEFGKLFYDFAKIGGAIAVITPLAKGDELSLATFISVLATIALGTYIINKGVQDG